MLPLLLMLLLTVISDRLAKHGLVLRSIPWEVLFWLLIFSIIVFVAGIGILLYKWGLRKGRLRYKVIAGCMDTILVVGSLLFLGLCFLGYAFSYEPEHVVERNNQKMVACVNSFTDVYVRYYEYKGRFFRGSKILGEEWYGSGGYDPFTTSMDVKPLRSTFEGEENK